MSSILYHSRFAKTASQGIFVIAIIAGIIGCGKNIYKGSALPAESVKYITSLGLLEPDEVIVALYTDECIGPEASLISPIVSGNFFTDRRIAGYWIDIKDANDPKNSIRSVYYKDIVSIDTNSRTGLTYAAFIITHTVDQREVRFYVDGSQQEINAFFNGVLTTWQKSR